MIAVVPISPIFSGLLGAPIGFTHVALCLLTIALYGVNPNSNIFKVSILWILFEFFISLITRYHVIYLRQCVALFLCMLVLTNFNKQDLKSFETILRLFVIFGLICSYLSVLATIIAPIDTPFSFPNPDGRLNGIYYLTFSNETVGGFIRPAFLFDEPGAFATIIALWAILAKLLGKFNGYSLIIVTLGLITQSLALIIFLFFILFQLKPRSIVISVFYFVVFLTVYQFLPEEIKLFNPITNRVFGGEITDNNRTSQIPTIFDNLDFNIFSFGALAVKGPEFIAQIGDVSSNIFTPLFHYGIYQSLPFYLGILLVILQICKRPSNCFVSLAFLLIIFQRPYYANVGYSMLIFINFILLVAPDWFAVNQIKKNTS